MYKNPYLMVSSPPSLDQKGMEYVQRANQDSSSPTTSTIVQLEGYHHYALNLPSQFSFASSFAVGSLSAVVSVFSVLSFMSFLSVNSILSVASVNSVLSIGCVNSILTICDPRDMNYRAAVAETPMAATHDPHHPNILDGQRDVAEPRDPHHPNTNPKLQFVLDGQRRPPADDLRAPPDYYTDDYNVATRYADGNDAPPDRHSFTWVGRDWRAPDEDLHHPSDNPSEDLCPCASEPQPDLGWMDWVSMAPVRGMMDDVYGYFDDTTATPLPPFDGMTKGELVAVARSPAWSHLDDSERKELMDHLSVFVIQQNETDLWMDQVDPSDIGGAHPYLRLVN